MIIFMAELSVSCVLLLVRIITVLNKIKDYKCFQLVLNNGYTFKQELEAYVYES